MSNALRRAIIPREPSSSGETQKRHQRNRLVDRRKVEYWMQLEQRKRRTAS